MKTAFNAILFFLLVLSGIAGPRSVQSFNTGWKFCTSQGISDTLTVHAPGYDDSRWTDITLPHSAYLEPLVIINPRQGISYYRKHFLVENSWKGRKVFLRFEGAMQVAEVFINGTRILKHTGGYLPFTADLTDHLNYGAENLVSIRLDNRDNPQIPPGKSSSTLDFCYYSGIYRNVNLIITDKTYITDPVFANQVAGGGNFIAYSHVSRQKAIIGINTSVRNDDPVSGRCQVVYSLFDAAGNKIYEAATSTAELNPFSDYIFNGKMELVHPSLWSPDDPYLYTLKTTLLKDHAISDETSEKIGIREIRIQENTFLLNGEPLYLRGTNRHQEYPYIGNAVPDNAQYRDAVKIREAGFNIVRLSHYPQSEAFMNACDELGLLVIDCIPGWQFIGDSIFMDHSYRDARELIRRDRNHACVAMWELSLNETSMPDSFMEKMAVIAWEESPQHHLYTCGWINKYYDVFIPARQHAQAPHYWKNYSGPKPFFTAEYGDWEYYAQNAGFNQTEFAGLKEEERSSRQLRGAGEKRLLQQALNFQEAHNDNLKSKNMGDANWLMFDYNRGYAPDIEASGIMDIFRLPKFVYWFFQSQRNPGFISSQFNSGPMVKIASFNQKSSDSLVTVYSNCEEVELYQGDKLIKKQRAVPGKYSDSLPYPPLQFQLPDKENSDLVARGYIKEQKVAEDKVPFTGIPQSIRIGYGQSGIDAGINDVIFLYARVSDQKGYLVPGATNKIEFRVEGDAVLIGDNPAKAEAGIASILLRTGMKGGKIIIHAAGENLDQSSMTLDLKK